MINQLKCIVTKSMDPYKNLALEEYLLNHVREGEAILYLWQNEKTVVIGRNQNPWKECRCERLEKDGGHLARRLSGGGAVFHDMGNLNFTFLMKREDFDIERQTMIILKAMKTLGIHGEKTGRNDIVVDGKKVSGHAYFESPEGCYHHGTIMVNVQQSRLAEYLNVDTEKMKSNGVDSVVSRVRNLTDYRPELTIEEMKAAIKQCFQEEYNLRCEQIAAEEISCEAKDELEQKYGSWEWLYGRKLAFTNAVKEKFDWGLAEITYNVQSGLLKELEIFSDSLYPEAIDLLKENLRGIRYKKEDIAKKIHWLKESTEEERNPLEKRKKQQIFEDVGHMLSQSIE